MKLSPVCPACLLRRQTERVRSYADKEKSASYIREVCRIVADALPEESSPVLIARINTLYREYYGCGKNFDLLKKEYNTLMLAKEDAIRDQIFAAQDPLLAALKYARVGNYIDFGALGSVDNDTLEQLLAGVPDEYVNLVEYEHLKCELASAKKIAYLTDNCGEIVLDKLFIQQLQHHYHHISVEVIVRGEPVLNDAVMQDALETGLTSVCSVTGNGTAIGGTWLPELSTEARRILDEADLIISKGQGNFETLRGSGLNVYYLFLCKCDVFVELFNLERYKGVLINERRCQ